MHIHIRSNMQSQSSHAVDHVFMSATFTAHVHVAKQTASQNSHDSDIPGECFAAPAPFDRLPCAEVGRQEGLWSSDVEMKADGEPCQKCGKILCYCECVPFPCARTCVCACVRTFACAHLPRPFRTVLLPALNHIPLFTN